MEAIVCTILGEPSSFRIEITISQVIHCEKYLHI